MTTHRKKLIEVALPLGEINDASAYDKMPGIGAHPKGIHHWWARLPLPTARAILFASVVDDPTSDPRFADKTEEEQDAERERLFGILRRLMQKKLHEHPEVYAEALKEMERCCDGKLPEVLDPFAGGGSIPLEAHRMGFVARASDLNPVAVLINKACLEIVPRWLNHAPVHPDVRDSMLGTRTSRPHDAGGTPAVPGYWHGSAGLAEDVRRYGADILKQAKEKIGHLYPKAKLPKELGGGEADVIAWIWARTVASPNPVAKGAHVPLISTFWLRKKSDRPIWLTPQIQHHNQSFEFSINSSDVPKDKKSISMGTKESRGRYRCLFTGVPIDSDYLKKEGSSHSLGTSLLSVIISINNTKIYLPASKDQSSCANNIVYEDLLDGDVPSRLTGGTCHGYGLDKWSRLFTPRQLHSLIYLSDAVINVYDRVRTDAIKSGMKENDADFYAKSVVTFLAFAIDRCADFNNSLCRWSSSNEKVMNLFGRQAIPMVWDFAEANIFGKAVGAWSTCLNYVADCVGTITSINKLSSTAVQQDATKLPAHLFGKLLISTDPPYYDNIGYAALSDFFYVWLRRSLGKISPAEFKTLLTPKLEELTAIAPNFDGGKVAAKNHFESGFREAFDRFRQAMDIRFPLTVYYAFKQSDDENDSNEDDNDSKITLTTGWETLLEALVSSGFQITATWPVRASQAWRMVSMGTNALASYIVLACRPRDDSAKSATRHNFRQALQRELPNAVRKLQSANIAPVDLAQAAIGPGMAIYSRYDKVVESDGSRLTVRTALQLINQVLGETLNEQENDFDSDTRWAVTWFKQHGFEDGAFGTAEELAVSQSVSVQGLVDGGILFAKGGKARLLRTNEMEAEWNPESDTRISIWECTAQLVRALQAGGETRAAPLLAAINRRSGLMPPAIKELAYLLFQTCEKNSWTKDALGYNALVASWSSIEVASKEITKPASDQGEFALI